MTVQRSFSGAGCGPFRPLVFCIVLRVGNVDVLIWCKFTRVVGCSLSSQLLRGVCRVGHDTG